MAVFQPLWLRLFAFSEIAKKRIFMTMTMEKNNDSTHAVAARHLMFALGRESYGIPVLKVREIIRAVQITVVPRMPDFIRGVINLRGKIIPIVDLRLKLSLPVLEETERACVIVVEV